MSSATTTPADAAPPPVAAAPAPVAQAPRPDFLERIRRMFGDPNPIVVKELRATFRTALFIRFLYIITLIVGIIVLAGGAAFASGEVPPAEVGHAVFQIFFGAALFVLSLVAAPYASTALTIEKEQRTYESLILSGMSPWRIVWGKFLAAYGSFALVLVALAPVVGIAFLFGGISPWHVITGYLGLLLVLAPAIAFGIAISARLSSTRIAIVITLLLFFFVAGAGTIISSILGEPARRAWGFGMVGPFWFTDALVVRPFALDTFALLIVLPLYVFLMPVWFLLASAVAAVRPAADDRSTPLKVWAVASVLGNVALVAVAVGLSGGGVDAGRGGIVAGVLGGFVLLFYALLLSNEPPLPPRLVELRAPSWPIWRRSLLVVGPGAAPTLRFTSIVIVVLALALAVVPSVIRHVLTPSYVDHGRMDAALLVLLVGNAPVALFCASFAAWLRAVLRNGVAARVLALAAVGAATLLPFLFAIVIDVNAFDHVDRETPAAMLFSPAYPSILAVIISDSASDIPRAFEMVVPAVCYGLLALFFWVMLEARVVKVKRAAAEWRQRREERARHSVPPPSLREVQAAARASKPPTPPPAHPAVAVASLGEPPPLAPAVEPAAKPPVEPPVKASPRDGRDDGAGGSGGDSGSDSGGGAPT